MPVTAADLMRCKVISVDPDVSLVDLERRLMEARVTGMPVLEDGRLVGIISRSDVVRQLVVEQSLAEMISDFYHDSTPLQQPLVSELEDVASRVGRRIELLEVRNIMIRSLITVPPDASLSRVAQVLVEHHIHRVLVTEGERLLGIITSLDLVNLLGKGRAIVPE